jgi:hypothetical protein
VKIRNRILVRGGLKKSQYFQTFPHTFPEYREEVSLGARRIYARCLEIQDGEHAETYVRCPDTNKDVSLKRVTDTHVPRTLALTHSELRFAFFDCT